jgi:hypothetical protein
MHSIGKPPIPIDELKKKNPNIVLIKEDEIYYFWMQFSEYMNCCYDIDYFLDEFLDIPKCHYVE